MGILHVLAELKQPALVTLGDVSLRVGESDRDAAVALLKFVDDYIEEGETTYGDAEAVLVYNLLKAMADAGAAEPQDFMDDRGVRAMLDCLWWFRFLVASRPEGDDMKPRTDLDRAIAAGE